jgi:hypothetical protein
MNQNVYLINKGIKGQLGTIKLLPYGDKGRVGSIADL